LQRGIPLIMKFISLDLVQQKFTEALNELYEIVDIIRKAEHSSIPQGEFTNMKSNGKIIEILNLIDESLLADIAKNDEDIALIRLSIERLENQSKLEEIAENGATYFSRYTSSLKLNDLSLKTNILINLLKNKDFKDPTLIIDNLKELYINESLLHTDKLKILELNGNQIREHIDEKFWLSEGCAKEYHTDHPSIYFNL
jgi:hypothetical protein